MPMNKLQQARTSRAWSRRTLALKAKVTEQTITNLEDASRSGKLVQERIRAGVSRAMGLDESVLFKAGRVR